MYEIAFLRTYDTKLMASGNAIDITAAVTPYFALGNNSNIYVIINISVQTAPDSSIFRLIKSQKSYPDNYGLVNMDIASIADAYLDYFVPPVDLDNTVKCLDQIKQFKVQLSLYNGTELLNSIEDIVTIIKAGSSYDAPLSLDNVTETLLAITAAEENVHIDDVFFLYLLIPPASYQLSIDVVVKFLNATGAEQEITVQPFAKIANEAKAKIVCIPVNYHILMQDTELSYGAVPISYTVHFNYVEGGFNFNNINPITYVLEQRNFYNTRQLLYRSSLGSLMPIRLKGNIESEANYDYQQSGQTPISYIKDGNIVGTAFQDQSSEDFKHKGDTGFITAFEIERLRDFFLSGQRWQVQPDTLLPIIVNNKSVKYGTNSDNLFSMLIEWQHAFKNNFYALHAVRDITCPSMVNFFAKQIIANNIRVFYTLPAGHDYFKITLTFPGEDPQYFYQSGNKGVADIAFTRPSSADGATIVNLKAQVVCQRYNKVPSLGAAFSYDLPLLAAITPIGAVANADIFNLAAGFVTPQIMPVSVLANDYDASNRVLTCVPVTNVATTAGGVISISSAGIVTYTPPSGTFTGADYYTYQMVAGADPAINGLITFNIANNASTIYASTRYGYTTPFGYGTIYNDMYIQFKNTAGYFGAPVPVINLAVNYKRIVSVFNSVNFDVAISVTETNFTATFNGTETKVFTGPLEEFVEQVDFSVNKIVTAFVVLPGAGYNVG